MRRAGSDLTDTRGRAGEKEGRQSRAEQGKAKRGMAKRGRAGQGKHLFRDFLHRWFLVFGFVFFLLAFSFCLLARIKTCKVRRIDDTVVDGRLLCMYCIEMGIGWFMKLRASSFERGAWYK